MSEKLTAPKHNSSRVASKAGSYYLGRFNSALDEQVADSLTAEQKKHIDEAVLSLAVSRTHKVDIRNTISIFNKRYYYVLLFGKDYRHQYKNSIISIIFFILLTIISLGSLTVGLFIITYLIKSAAGVDIFDNYSLGLWDWFKEKII
ncbi:hypothetical protein [Vibrio sp. HN007]|uniref:hypothetical protein n=1 Tax=Vibrio iocasae TaxID=3098914 RepID=UPI0035D4F680